MAMKRESRGRFRLGSEMEESSGRKRLMAPLEIDDSHSNKRHPNFSVPAIGEPYVKYKIPRYDFEKWDWMLFQWPHDRADANFEMIDIDLDALIEAEKKRFEEFIDKKQTQVEEQEIHPPADKSNSTKNCIENLLDDSVFCLADDSS